MLIQVSFILAFQKNWRGRLTMLHALQACLSLCHFWYMIVQRQSTQTVKDTITSSAFLGKWNHKNRRSRRCSNTASLNMERRWCHIAWIRLCLYHHGPILGGERYSIINWRAKPEVIKCKRPGCEKGMGGWWGWTPPLCTSKYAERLPQVGPLT